MLQRRVWRRRINPASVDKACRKAEKLIGKRFNDMVKKSAMQNQSCSHGRGTGCTTLPGAAV